MAEPFKVTFVKVGCLFRGAHSGNQNTDLKYSDRSLPPGPDLHTIQFKIP